MNVPPSSESPPSAAWGPSPAASTGDRPSGVTVALLPGQVVALAGGVLVVVSAWLDWIRPSRPFGPAVGFSAYNVPAQFLVRDSGLFVSRGGPSLGVLVFLLGAACLVAALVRPVSFLALPAGIGGLGVGVWYMIRLQSSRGSTFRDLVGVGAFVAIIGGLIAVLGGILTLVRR